MKTKAALGISLFLFTYCACAAMSDHASVPPTVVESADPNVMINMSVETPMGGAAYNDQPGTLSAGSVCGGRVNDGGTVGICYFTTEEYLGYFDPNKCYDYNTVDGYFEPNGATNADHSCNGRFSGNMLNWSLTTAIDEFRWAMTGGNRIVDTAAETVIKRARKQNSDNWFPVKLLKSARNVDPSTVTPWNNASIYIYNTDFGVQFGTTRKGSQKANYNVRVKVCDAAQGLEDNCTTYGASHKPEGLIQNNADQMRFALMSYSADGSQSRDGGVLRANMKYVGTIRPAAAGGTEVNPNAEFSATDGTYISNPDGVPLVSGVTNSGVINYVNQFAESQGYKSYDPIGELYYECIRYFKNLGNTPEYSTGLTDAQKDGFPVLTTWDDPIQASCQNNYIIGINDANPWLDKQLPGTHFTSSPVNGTNLSGSDWGEPSNPDAAIDVTALTNTVGVLQGIDSTSQCVGGGYSDYNASATNKNISGLGEVMGTCPYVPKQNSYYIAGLAYYARTNDLRSDFSGDQTITTFMIDTQEYSASPLTGQMNMLWLAGKYGGFDELNKVDTNSDGNNLEPDQTAEWDADGDGQPDNYVLATDPRKLVDGLQKAFADVQERVNAGSAAAVVANSATGTGAIIQGLYEPTTIRTGARTTWGGMLHSLFIDDRSLIREDTNGNDQLDNYSTDTVVQFVFDNASNTTKIHRYTGTTNGDLATGTQTVHGLDELNTIWDSRDQLAGLSNATIGTQRTTYDALAGTGRYIFTWIDTDNDGVADSAEVIDFVASNFPSTNNNFRYLDVSAANAPDLVDFIRGKEGISGFRSRTIDYDNDGTDEAWRLGDIVHSSPVVVGEPGSKYDVLYADSSYSAFRSYYADRRQVVYVGANDGMLHAFNGGFWNETTKAFDTNNGTDPAHPLGSELWGYVPMNLLPHLQWLKEQNYPHVYYVDGSPQVFDVNIFTADTDHPSGWGTILVVGMRFGGGPIDVDTDGDAVDDKTLRSAYLILDITNPEIAPTLIAEISHADLGYTTSVPALIKARQPGVGFDWTTPTSNFWNLVFGSGPDDLQTATSTKTAKIYGYDLASQSFIAGFGPFDLGEATSFVGDPLIVDWEPDYVDDMFYFGIAGGTVASPTGKLKRFDFATNAFSDLIAPSQPFLSMPIMTIAEDGRRWIHAGTGRLLVDADNQSLTQQSFYGIQEPVDVSGIMTLATVLVSDLENTTDIQIFNDGTLKPLNLEIPTGTDVDTFDQLVTAIPTHRDGWYRNFDYDGTNPSTRNVSSAIRLSTLLLFTDYTPSADECQPEGTSSLFLVHYKTGTAFAYAPFGTDSTVTNGTAELTYDSISLGRGLSWTPIIHRSSNSTSGTINVITQQSTGTVTSTPVTLPTAIGGRQSWRILHD